MIKLALDFMSTAATTDGMSFIALVTSQRLALFAIFLFWLNSVHCDLFQQREDEYTEGIKDHGDSNTIDRIKNEGIAN